ncbi:anti-sigma factor domain-containing protein [Duganella sp. HH101]|uniref:anti-sigma factor n=1 Tax=Duganella sp. HH101 TaxID=1781066 RepID=UPI0008754C3D|nr:anti-sigma-K factor rskA [Duganella sp. HH101]
MNQLNTWRIVAGVALAGCAALGALLLWPAPAAPAYVAVLSAPQDNGAGWVVQIAPDRRLTLTPLHGTLVANRKALQFWTTPAGGASVSLGLVEQDRQVKLALDKQLPLAADQMFELTLEPAPGSPSGQPAGPVLYTGVAVRTN